MLIYICIYIYLNTWSNLYLCVANLHIIVFGGDSSNNWYFCNTEVALWRYTFYADLLDKTYKGAISFNVVVGCPFFLNQLLATKLNPVPASGEGPNGVKVAFISALLWVRCPHRCRANLGCGGKIYWSHYFTQEMRDLAPRNLLPILLVDPFPLFRKSMFHRFKIKVFAGSRKL